MSPPSWKSLISSSIPPSRLSQCTGFGLCLIQWSPTGSLFYMSFMFPCCSLHSSTLSFPNWAHKPVHCICLSVPALCIQMTFDLRIHRPRLLASVQDSSKGGRSPLWHQHGSLVPLFATCLFHCPSPSTQGVILKYPPINFLHIQTYASWTISGRTNLREWDSRTLIMTYLL